MKTRENEMHPQMLALMSNVWGAFQISRVFRVVWVIIP
jgi:hypothetical protein